MTVDKFDKFHKWRWREDFILPVLEIGAWWRRLVLHTGPTDYHTHLSASARAVSLHRTGSLPADYPALRAAPSKVF